MDLAILSLIALPFILYIIFNLMEWLLNPLDDSFKYKKYNKEQFMDIVLGKNE